MKSRLSYITGLIEEDYYEIWDTCCDHGKLGIELINRKSTSVIHFVDCVPEIMKELKSKIYNKGLHKNCNVKFHTNNAQDLILSDKKSLICICGVGGVTAIEIISGLNKRNDLSKHHFILSVQYKIPRLRRFLRELGFKVQKEILCFEGKWAHEMLRISLQSGYDIDLAGSPMFDLQNSKHMDYLKRSINHYKKKSLTDNCYEEVLNSYIRVLDK